MPKEKSPKKVVQNILQIKEGSLIEIKPNGKYLLIMPTDAHVKDISIAISQFFDPTPVFVLAANDVNSIKIAELVEGK